MKTLTIEVDSKEYHEVEELLRLVAVTPEHAISEFVKDLISQKDEILKRYEEGEAAKQLIEEAVAPSLRKVVDRTLQQRQMLRELELHKKVEPISKLRKSWGSAL